MEYKLQASSLNLYYGRFHALKNINIGIRPRSITAIIGPSGCGKSTLLRCFNRLNDIIKSARVTGRILLDGADIFNSGIGLTQLRRRVGMVFQRPNPFPLSIFDNLAYGPRVHGMRDREELEMIVENSLRATMLWDDLKDRLNAPALSLSPEQQQRLCISRLVAVEPEVLLMDEPCSALDPFATAHIEDLMRKLAEQYTIVIVTHNMQQAARVSTETAFMLLGELVEFGDTTQIFQNPRQKKTEEYVSGRYG
ncbi:MAG TPA: phosphate ABC transporter ATP-binding protein PstB [Phycisphaerae bacterium]|nr:phosphate ABC transporter ATP-binding protein [Phycisphaerae bacterium]HOB76610.1 phosphate ABC transporter ATP-binding protein PstB [Phycisphaerae bacterium]HOJ54790.1 phosphate ABC transporter ATP-binding protein PstB [Phycisphaerae bacterium]HOL26932.1 phosphate ABC transporter ATP-binding protein PstB [Phycisphaerae bacterium]HPP20887.1 phosphate ABC transporter ATP-binding protein PstB [Phycisphaerae bacterium]